jgi:hypothetical protein
MSSQNINETIAEIQDQWMDINGVVGIGQGLVDSKDSILVFVSIVTPEVINNIPVSYKGFPVRIMNVGVIYSQ